MMLRILLASGFILTTGSLAAAPRPVVLELFTSQGCSSCPPADAVLTSLAGRKDLLPLAFHVTYWNALGWRDPYSIEAATERQAAYAARLGGGSYTPEMVVDGRRGMVGSDRQDVTAAIAAARRATDESVPIQLSPVSGAIAISVGAGAGRGRIILIGFDARHETRVGRGENGGRTLIESNIVRSIRSIGDYSGAIFKASVPRGAGTDAAVLVQSADGSILGAARL